MKLLDSLLDAIVRLEGDALVMHVGEKPYVVTASSSMSAYRGPLAWGQVELSSRVLTFDAVSSMLVQILPVHQQQALTEFGAIEHEIPSPVGVADRFTVIAARGGEDVWLEVRRRPIETPQAAVSEAPSPPQVEAVAAQPVSESAPEVAVHAAPVAPVAEPATATEPDTEPDVHDIGPVAEVHADADEQSVAQIQPEASESIVVAIPGQAAEEFQLDAVPDNAIQIIDDEPQGVPTEEEVDAMLAATAAALVTSGSGSEAGEIDGQTELYVVTDAEEPAVAASSDVAPVTDEASPIGEPGFELSPPPLFVPAGEDVEEVLEGSVAIAEAPIGTPLFSEEAVLAAAATPVAEVPVVEPVAEVPVVELVAEALVAEPVAEAPAADLPVEEAVVAEAASAGDAPVAEPLIVAAEVPAAPPVVELPPVVETWTAADQTLIVETFPLAGQTPIVQTWSAADQTPIAETWAAADQTPIVETWAAADQTAIVETWPVADQTPIVETWAVAEQTPIVQTWPAPDQTAIVETWPAADQTPIAEARPEVDHTAIVEIWPAPAVDMPVAAPAPIAEEAPVATAPYGVAEPSFQEALSEANSTDVLAAEPMSDDLVNTLDAAAEPAVSEPTPQVWTPPVAEIPMEITPELRRQETVAEVAAQATATEAPSLELPGPVYADAHAQAEDETRQAVVVPLARTHIKPESPSVPFTPSEDAALMHTLRVAAARGASTVYVVAQSKPMIRIDGEIGPLESEPVLTAADVDRLVMELAPPRRRDALQNGPVEWLCDVPEIGRVRCQTFRDHRGPGILFRMFPPRAISADQLGLTPEVQALCQQSDGLVLVTGARASGKSTLLNAFVDLINRTRSDHLITVESQIGFVHESRRSFISQRESRGDAELAATYARAALREDPDVMMIEDLKSADLISAALEAAESGRLVLASVPASSTIGAIERLIEAFPADRRAKARTSLATALRGVVAQVLLRRVKGGRVAAREILLNTPAVSTLVLEGKTFQLPVALDSGRRHGMVPLTDSLAAQVRDGTVHVAEAYRKALDRAALVALLKREGVDTSFAERLA